MSSPLLPCPCDKRALSPPIPEGAYPCVQCHGQWLPGDVVEAAIGHVAIAPRVEDVRVEPSTLPCPQDGTALLALHYRGVEVDHCPQCHGVWLDRGELKRLALVMDDDRKAEQRRQAAISASNREVANILPDLAAQEAVWGSASIVVRFLGQLFSP
jgi:Zn-finger nucleic acid-binding protein